MIEIWYRGAMYKQLSSALFGLALAFLAQGCGDEPEVDLCSSTNMPSVGLWEICTTEEQCPAGSSCSGSFLCAPSCVEDADCGPNGHCTTVSGTCLLPCAEYPAVIYSYASCDESPDDEGGWAPLTVNMCEQCGPIWCPWYDDWAEE